MTPDELKTRLEELRTLITDKLVELEEDTNWGTEEERAEVVVALDQLIVQAQAMSELLQVATISCRIGPAPFSIKQEPKEKRLLPNKIILVLGRPLSLHLPRFVKTWDTSFPAHRE